MIDPKKSYPRHRDVGEASRVWVKIIIALTDRRSIIIIIIILLFVFVDEKKQRWHFIAVVGI
jgi:hypothetical protein